jgi:hypothetical protein
MAEFRSDNPADAIKIEDFEGFGEITVGGTSSNWYLIFVAFSLQNNPQVNKFLLANKVKLQDRMTKTKIFPREGMALPNGEVYHVPESQDTEN